MNFMRIKFYFMRRKIHTKSGKNFCYKGPNRKYLDLSGYQLSTPITQFYHCNTKTAIDNM